MIAFLSSWKAWLGILLPLGAGVTLFIPSVALAVGNFLSTNGGRLVALLLVVTWFLWMAFAWVEANAYQRGAADQKTKIEQQDSRAVEAGRKARIPVAECYAKDGLWSLEEGLCVLPQ